MQGDKKAMGNGHHNILPTIGSQLPQVLTDGQAAAEKHLSPQEESSPKNPKANAALLFDKNWQNSQAAERQNNLTTKIFSGENNSTLQRDSLLQRQTEQAKNLLGQTWENLISVAKEHQDLEPFHSQPKEFWDNVQMMSEVRVVQTYVNGSLEPRAVSRYGELLESLNRSGGQLESFLNSLPPAERNIFQARYQLNQTFGANELFVGQGIALDKNGQFPVRVFLSSSGTTLELPAHTVLSLLGGDLSVLAKNPHSEMTSVLGFPKNGLPAEEFLFFENASLFMNGQILLDAKSAALLGLNLALYQNINANFSLEDVAPETLLQKNQGESAAPRTTTSQNTFEKARTADAPPQQANQILVAGALINGALTTIEKYRKAEKSRVGLWTDNDLENAGFRFAAGATGAMMGATIGCVVPLAEKAVGEILGFATSVVVGLTDSGVRKLGANALVSVVAGGVQNLLTASGGNQASLANGSSNKFLNPAAANGVFEDDLRQRLFNNRINAFLTS